MNTQTATKRRFRVVTPIRRGQSAQERNPGQDDEPVALPDKAPHEADKTFWHRIATAFENQSP